MCTEGCADTLLQRGRQRQSHHFVDTQGCLGHPRVVQLSATLPRRDGDKSGLSNESRHAAADSSLCSIAHDKVVEHSCLRDDVGTCDVCVYAV